VSSKRSKKGMEFYMKKIIIAYASYGGGHLSAAKNLKEYIELNYPNYKVYLFDCMKYINKVIDKVCGSTYSKLTTDIPWFWGKIYYHTQEPIFGKIVSLSNKILSYKLRGILKEIEPDIIISTHFFVSHMFSILKQKKKLPAKLATIITDYGDDPYNEWTTNHEFVDYIFVAHNEIKNKLIENNIPENKIFNTGIPVSNKFLINYNKSEIFNTLNLNENKKTILFFGGGELGLGKTKTLKIFENIVNNFKDIQLIAVAGKNENLKNNFEKIVFENNMQENIRVLGFTDKIAELMSISNLVITKPGGLTSTECLVSHVPILAINPIPGQEEENANFLEKNGAAIWLKKSDDISSVLYNLLNNDDILFNMKQNTIKIAKPNSTKDICEILL
jgi:processive 1,2-diacylglycerol beta-glucosyltransferase